MPYIRKDNNTVTNKLVYVSGPPGSEGESGPQGPQGPAGSGSDFNSADITVSTDGTLGVGALDHPNLLKACVVTLTSSAVRTIHGMLSDITIGNMNPIKEIRNGNSPGGSDFILIHNSGSAASAKDRFNIIEGSSFTIRPGESVKFGGYDYSAQKWLKSSDTEALLFTRLTSGLSSRSGAVDGEVVLTVGHQAANDGGGAQWRFSSGVSAGADNITKINCSNGQWQFVTPRRFINARTLGAGLGLGNDPARLRAAVTLASTTAENECHIPKGTYLFTGGGTRLEPSGATIISGSGAGTLLRRTDTFSTVVDFGANGCVGAKLKDLKIEMDATNNFLVAVDLRNSTNITVENCDIGLSEAAALVLETGILASGGSQTMHAVAAEITGGHTIRNSRFRYMQCKMAGAGGGRITRVQHNHFYRPFDFAMSFVGVASGAELNPYLTDLFVTDNMIDSPWATGAIYIGGDGEAAAVTTLERIHIKNNSIFGSFASGGGLNRAQILVHLGITSRGVQICGNTITNDQGTYQDSVAIRVRSVNSSFSCDGVLIDGNHIDGCDHAGIYLDLNGKGVKVTNNKLRRCRGIYLWATGGDIEDAIVADNSCDATGLYGIYAFAQTGNIRGLTVARNKAYDIAGGATTADNVGFRYEAAATYRLSAESSGNECWNKALTTTGYGAWHLGQGTVDIHHVDDHFHDLANGFLRRVIGAGAGQLAAGFATGHHNRGSGVVPCTREVTVRLTDVSAPGSASVKSPCAGKVIGIRGSLGGAVTGSDSIITTAIQPAAGGGFVAITDGGFTVTASGSARGDRDQAIPSALNTVERLGDLQATTDGGSTGTQWEDVTFIIQEDAA